MVIIASTAEVSLSCSLSLSSSISTSLATVSNSFRSLSRREILGEWINQNHEARLTKTLKIQELGWSRCCYSSQPARLGCCVADSSSTARAQFSLRSHVPDQSLSFLLLHLHLATHFPRGTTSQLAGQLLHAKGETGIVRWLFRPPSRANSVSL